MICCVYCPWQRAGMIFARVVVCASHPAARNASEAGQLPRCHMALNLVYIHMRTRCTALVEWHRGMDGTEVVRDAWDMHVKLATAKYLPQRFDWSPCPQRGLQKRIVGELAFWSGTVECGGATRNALCLGSWAARIFPLAYPHLTPDTKRVPPARLCLSSPCHV